MKKTNKLLMLLALFLFSATTFGQGFVKGIIQDAKTNETLIGATVIIEGTTIGTTTDLDGSFSFEAPTGNQVIRVSFIGYTVKLIEIMVSEGSTTDIGIIQLEPSAIGLDEINVLASVAIDRKTPVAVTTIKGETIERKLGSQEFPEIMKLTPGVYPTKSGGGFGDARINIRGFDQRNVAVMINGIPVNDMENGWVYWSNWAGLGDATRTLQVQRGLGASKLAINSVGGTINIITKTTDAKKGGSFKQSMTDYGRTKSMLSLSTGKLSSGTAITFVGSRTKGPGYIDATYVDAWSYFLTVSQEIGKNHNLVFTAIGAPQQHGQRDGYNMLTQEEFDMYGTKYNKNWGWLYGEKYNTRNNYYHKPQMSLNWYWTISEKSFLATSAYWSFGRGGGSGTLGYGSYKYDPPRYNYQKAGKYTGLYDWDSMVVINSGNYDTTNARLAGAYPPPDNGDTSFYSRSNLIMRNSVNHHNWFGFLSTLTQELTDNIELIAGIDARYYKGIHYREVRDLLGGQYWFDKKMGARYDIGDKIAYHNDGIVTYVGAFAQAEYTADDFSAFIAGTISNTWNKRIDYMSYMADWGSGDPSDDKNTSKTLSDIGYNGKIGANYNLDEYNNVFFNAGYYSRVPNFRFMFLNYRNDVNEDRENEKVYAAEIGYGFNNNFVKANLNAYYTIWDDISKLGGYRDSDGDYHNVYFFGLKEDHIGVELSVDAQVTNNINLGAIASIGNWKYNDNVEVNVYDDDTHELDTIVTLFTKDLKVYDQPQTQIGVFGRFQITKQLDLGCEYNYYADNYAMFTPEERTKPEDTEQSYEFPDYGIFDIRAGFAFQFAGLKSYASINCYNAFDTYSLVEGEDTGIKQDDGSYKHVLKKGWWTWGRTFNFSLKVNF